MAEDINKNVNVNFNVTGNGTQGINTFNSSLNSLIGTAGKAGKNLNQVAKSSDDIGDSFKSTSRQTKDLEAGLNRTQKAAYNLGKAYNSLSKSATGLLGQFKSIAATVGAPATFAAGVNALSKYSNELVAASAQMNKYGKSISQVESQMDSMSKALKLTRTDVIGLMRDLEKSMLFFSSMGAEKVLKNIQKVVGSNVSEINKYSSAVANLVSMYPELQTSVERLNETDKRRLQSAISLSIQTGKLSVQQSKMLSDYINQNSQIDKENEKRLKREKEYNEVLQDVQRVWQNVAIAIGKQVMPYLERFAKYLSENEDLVTSIFEKITKFALPIMGAVTAAKQLLNIWLLIRGAVEASRVAAALLGKGGKGGKGGIVGMGLDMILGGGGKILGKGIGKILGKGGSKGLMKTLGSLIKGSSKTAKIGSGVGIAALLGEFALEGVQSKYEGDIEKARASGDTEGVKSAQTAAGAAGLGKSALGIGGMTAAGAAVGSVAIPIPVVGTAIGAVVGALAGVAMEFTNIWNSVQNFVQGTGISEWLQETWNIVRDTFEGMYLNVKDILSQIWDSTKTIFIGIWETTKTILSQIWGFYKTVWGYVGKAVQTGIKWFGTFAQVVTDFVGGAWQMLIGAINRIGSVIGSVISTVNSVLNRIAKNPLVRAGLAVGGAIASTAKAVGGAVYSGAKAVGGAVYSGAKAVGGAAYSAAKTAYSYTPLGMITNNAYERGKKAREERERAREAARQQRIGTQISESSGRIAIGRSAAAEAARNQLRGTGSDEASKISSMTGASVSIAGDTGVSYEEQLVKLKEKEKSLTKELSMDERKRIFNLSNQITAREDDLKKLKESGAEAEVIKKRESELKAIKEEKQKIEKSSIKDVKAYEQVVKDIEMVENKVNSAVQARRDLLESIKGAASAAMSSAKGQFAAGTALGSSAFMDAGKAQRDQADVRLKEQNLLLTKEIQTKEETIAKSRAAIEDATRLEVQEKVAAGVIDEKDAQKTIEETVKARLSVEKSIIDAEKIISEKQNEIAQNSKTIVENKRMELDASLRTSAAAQATADAYQRQLTTMFSLTSALGGNLDTGGLIEVSKKERQARSDLKKSLDDALETKRKYDEEIASGSSDMTTSGELYQKVLQDIASIQNNISQSRLKEMGAYLQAANYNKLDLETQQSKLGLLEAEKNLADSMVTGLGASVEMRLQIIEQIRTVRSEVEKQLQANNKARKKAMDEIQDEKVLQATLRNLDKQRLDLQNKKVSLVQKEAQEAKALRDGWVSALQAQTIGTGRIMKIKLDQDQALRAITGNMGGVRSSSSGAVTRAGQSTVGFTSGERFDVGAGGQLDIRNRRIRGSSYTPDAGVDPAITNEGVADVRDLAKEMTKQTERLTNEVMRSGGSALGAGQTDATGAATAGVKGKGGGTGRVTGQGTTEKILNDTISSATGKTPAQIMSSGGKVVQLNLNIAVNSKEDAISQITSQIRKAFGQIEFGRSE